jgi:hypothetical protein
MESQILAPCFGLIDGQLKNKSKLLNIWLQLAPMRCSSEFP